MIRDIDNLKKSLDKAARYSEIEPQIKKIKEVKNQVFSELKQVRDQESKINAILDETNKEIEANNQEKDAVKSNLDTLQGEIEKIDKRIDSCYELKREKQEEWWKARYDHKVQSEEVDHIKWM